METDARMGRCQSNRPCRPAGPPAPHAGGVDEPACHSTPSTSNCYITLCSICRRARIPACRGRQRSRWRGWHRGSGSWRPFSGLACTWAHVCPRGACAPPPAGRAGSAQALACKRNAVLLWGPAATLKTCLPAYAPGGPACMPCALSPRRTPCVAARSRGSSWCRPVASLRCRMEASWWLTLTPRASCASTPAARCSTCSPQPSQARAGRQGPAAGQRQLLAPCWPPLSCALSGSSTAWQRAVLVHSLPPGHLSRRQKVAPSPCTLQAASCCSPSALR